MSISALGLAFSPILASAAVAQSTYGGGYGTPSGGTRSTPGTRATTGARQSCPNGTIYRNGRCQPNRDQSHGHDDTGAIIGAGAAILAIGAILETTGHKNRDRNDTSSEADNLLRYGPELPENYDVGTFWARGFGKDGWPIVLDFRPQPNTQTTLYVMFDKDEVWSDVIDSNGLDGRHLQLVTVPQTGWARKAKPATYYLRSMTLDYMGRPVAPAPVDVYGIGGGPRAVGSVAIEQLDFGPPTMQAGATANFDYHAKSPFDHTRTEVLRYAVSGTTIQLSQVMSQDAPDVSVGTHSGQWNGRDQGTGQVSIGAHRFQVRGWFTSDDKSWVGAVAPTQVMIR